MRRMRTTVLEPNINFQPMSHELNTAYFDGNYLTSNYVGKVGGCWSVYKKYAVIKGRGVRWGMPSTIIAPTSRERSTSPPHCRVS